MCALTKFIRERCRCLQFVGLMTIGAYGYNTADGPNPDFLVSVSIYRVQDKAMLKTKITVQ